jgi:hypothetical protein
MTAFKNTTVGKFLTGIWKGISEIWDNTIQPRLEDKIQQQAEKLKKIAKEDAEYLLEAGAKKLEELIKENLRPREWFMPIFNAIDAKNEEKGLGLSSTDVMTMATLVQGEARSAAMADGTTVHAIVTAEAEQAAPATDATATA